MTMLVHAIDCGRYSLCNGTFLSVFIKDITTLTYSVAYNLSIKFLVVIFVALLSSGTPIVFEDHLCFYLLYSDWSY